MQIHPNDWTNEEALKVLNHNVRPIPRTEFVDSIRVCGLVNVSVTGDVLVQLNVCISDTILGNLPSSVLSNDRTTGPG